jgi:hypothetical protein
MDLEPSLTLTMTFPGEVSAEPHVEDVAAYIASHVEQRLGYSPPSFGLRRLGWEPAWCMGGQIGGPGWGYQAHVDEHCRPVSPPEEVGGAASSRSGQGVPRSVPRWAGQPADHQPPGT